MNEDYLVSFLYNDNCTNEETRINITFDSFETLSGIFKEFFSSVKWNKNKELKEVRIIPTAFKFDY